MRLQRSSHGNILVVEAGGAIDSASAEQLGSFLQYEIDAGKRYLVLDLQGVDKLGQDGLWEMVTALKHARRSRGDLRLSQPSDRAREAIEMSGLDQIFRIYESQADAVASY
ncbi:MAG: STAS domain-containing protein [Chloroflexi bacterium]|nr:STAS domain-containing protein [Chloroflexota bacterium]